MLPAAEFKTHAELALPVALFAMRAFDIVRVFCPSSRISRDSMLPLGYRNICSRVQRVVVDLR
jgi:hypothetical protein